LPQHFKNILFACGKICSIGTAILSLCFTVAAQPDNGSIVHTGQATYYAATGDGNCMFGPSPNYMMVCAMNNKEYDTASVCGASIHLKGPKGEVTVRIVDRCPECPVGNVDLSKQAFMKIADTIQGRVAITWSYVETTVNGPIEYRIKTGSNQWWIGVQVLNHRTPIVQVEAMKNGSWSPLTRMEYNYFLDTTGLGAGPFSFRVTDFYGRQLVDENIPLKPDSIFNGMANFSSHAIVIEFLSRKALQTFPQTMLVTFTGVPLFNTPGKKYDIYTLTGGLVAKGRDSKLTYNNALWNFPKSGVYILKPDAH
jgi:expansin (peptidoglycan-binding protein)